MNPFDGLINDRAACRLCSREKISYQIVEFSGTTTTVHRCFQPATSCVRDRLVPGIRRVLLGSVKMGIHIPSSHDREYQHSGNPHETVHTFPFYARVGTAARRPNGNRPRVPCSVHGQSQDIRSIPPRVDCVQVLSSNLETSPSNRYYSCNTYNSRRLQEIDHRRCN